jgi:aminoglycoside 2''-phosphotransferase
MLTVPYFERLGRAHRDAIADQFASFLNALHAFPVERARALGYTAGQSLKEETASWRPFYPRVRECFTDRERALLEEALAGPSVQAPPARLRLVHDDLDVHHIFHDPRMKRLTGIIDFGDMALMDAAVDFYGLWDYGEELVDRVLAGYRHADARFKERTRDWFRVRRIRDIFLGIVYDKPQWLRWGRIFFSR